MIISVSDTFTHETPHKKKQTFDQEGLEKVVLSSIYKLGLNSEDFHWNEDGHLEVRTKDRLKLHTFMLHMEQLGLDLKMTKKTLIEIF